MSVREQLGPTRQDYVRAAFTGDFAILQEFLLIQKGFFWNALRLLDFLLRGFSQVILANNPISGLLIIISLAVTAPGTLLFSSVTGFLGLVLSMLIRDSRENIVNGLTVFNPLLVGAVSYKLIPMIYGRFDAFSVLLIILGTVFSVYLVRSMKNGSSPFTAWPFNLAEFVVLFLLYAQDNGLDTMEKLKSVTRMDNATSDATTADVSFIGENATRVHIDWGMMLQAVVMSGSQVFAVESVVTGSIVYLAGLLFSPVTTGFAFLGALIGSLAGITLFLSVDSGRFLSDQAGLNVDTYARSRLTFGVRIDEIYSGHWGYNTFLTGAALGGTFFKLNVQTAAATIVAIVYTVALQYSVWFIFRNIAIIGPCWHVCSVLKEQRLPVLSLPFVTATSLFLKLRNDSRRKTFPPPSSISFREEQRSSVNQQTPILPTNDPEKPEGAVKDVNPAYALNI